MTSDQQLFEKVKRDGEYWHRYSHCENKNIWSPSYDFCVCGQAFILGSYKLPKHISSINPDFTTPKGFFWLWQRVREKEWWPRFINIYGRIHNGYPVISTNLINPLKFRATLMEFWEIKETPNGT